MSEATMLIVDDSRLSRMMIKKYVLDAHPSWIIIEAVDGDDALEKSKGQLISCMTIDYNMPGMDGITLIKKLRETFKYTKIALLTANIQDSIKKQTQEVGVDFIQKPITQEKIQSYIKR
jgi:two-component system chemotaxis response regulator CheY